MMDDPPADVKCDKKRHDDKLLQIIFPCQGQDQDEENANGEKKEVMKEIFFKLFLQMMNKVMCAYHMMTPCEVAISEKSIMAINIRCAMCLPVMRLKRRRLAQYRSSTIARSSMLMKR